MDRIPMFIEEIRVPEPVCCEIMQRDKIVEKKSKKTNCPKKQIKFNNSKRKAL
jgi:hypothetical protein